MPKITARNNTNRIIDANINRVKEGLRVCEEITRFILDDRRATATLKKIRHDIDAVVRRLPGSPAQFIQARNSPGDVGRDIYVNELKRNDTRDIFFANIQRAKESVRVLEEFSKLSAKNTAKDFKKIRYGIYEAEKKIVKKIPALYYHR
ncbi:MAG: thiamine-phosphate pyrophosphorylase [Candidatus Omnitrophota bacterium]